VPNTDIVKGLKLPPLSIKLNQRGKPHIKVATCKVKANSICKYAKKAAYTALTLKASSMHIPLWDNCLQTDY
jgi:hypothetical protein